MSSWCTLFHNHHMESNTPHLSAVVGVFDPSGAPGSVMVGVVRSKASVDAEGVKVCQIYGRTTLALGVSDVSDWWGRTVGS